MSGREAGSDPLASLWNSLWRDNGTKTRMLPGYFRSCREKFDTEIVEKRNLKGHFPTSGFKEVLTQCSELAGDYLGEVNLQWWKNPKEINYENIKGEHRIYCTTCKELVH